MSIEEARKRREECAKHRSRRASVMGLLEAEKLAQRKRSNASIYNNSGLLPILVHRILKHRLFFRALRSLEASLHRYVTCSCPNFVVKQPLSLFSVLAQALQEFSSSPLQ